MAVRSSLAYPSRSLPFTLSSPSSPASSPKGPGQAPRPSPPFFDSRELSRRPAASAMESNRFLLVATTAAAAAAFQSADEPMHRRVKRERERERESASVRTRSRSAALATRSFAIPHANPGIPRVALRSAVFLCIPLNPFISLAVVALQIAIAITETSNDNRIERRRFRARRRLS